MASKTSVFWSAFAGKITATILIVVCTALGFGPEAWVSFLIDGLPNWVTPSGTRAALLTLALLTLVLLLFPLHNKLWPQQAASTDHWTERKRLEISVLANVSAGREPTATPIDKEPENTRLRELKDAISMGELDATLHGERPNVLSAVTLQSFEQYVAATNKPYWIEVLQRWQARKQRNGNKIAPTRISLIDLAKEAEKKGWKLRDGSSLHLLDFFDGVRQLGVDGKVSTYGRPAQMFIDMTRTEPLVLITPAEWRKHEIDVFSFVRWRRGEPAEYANDNFKTHIKCLPETGAKPRYFDIHLDRQAALAWLDTDAVEFRGRRKD